MTVEIYVGYPKDQSPFRDVSELDPDLAREVAALSAEAGSGSDGGYRDFRALGLDAGFEYYVSDAAEEAEVVEDWLPESATDWWLGIFALQGTEELASATVASLALAHSTGGIWYDPQGGMALSGEPLRRALQAAVAEARSGGTFETFGYGQDVADR